MKRDGIRRDRIKKDRRSNAKKERIIMLASSAFVLTALTMTGIYMQEGEEKAQDKGYTLDFTALEEHQEEQGQELAQNSVVGDAGTRITQKALGVTEDDLDYMPLEAGSGNIEIPGLTDAAKQTAEEEASPVAEAPRKEKDTKKDETAEQEKPGGEQPAAEQSQTAAEEVVVGKELHYAESQGLLRPVSGEVLIPFSMDGSVYFSTLDQYKYNPALMLDAEVGTPVAACAEGKVVSIFYDAEIGNAVTLELGDGYRLTYGQLQEICVSADSYVNPGEQIGTVAAPTKYYSVEGANLYLKLTCNDTPVNPEGLFVQ